MLALDPLPGAISEIIASCAATSSLTKADRYGLMAAILSDSLEEEEKYAIDRMLRSIRRKRIHIVDELSVECFPTWENYRLQEKWENFDTSLRFSCIASERTSTTLSNRAVEGRGEIPMMGFE